MGVSGALRQALTLALWLLFQSSAAAPQSADVETRLLLEAEALYDAEQYADALPLYREALGGELQRGEARKALVIRYRIAVTLHRLDRLEEALTELDAVTESATALGDDKYLAFALNRRGAIEQTRGDYRAALASYAAALEAARRTDRAKTTGRILSNLGAMRFRAGETAAALAHLREAERLFEQIGYDTGRAAALENLGVVDESLGDYARALEHVERALAIHRARGDAAKAGRALHNLGYIHDQAGATDEALDRYREALAAAGGDEAGAALTRNNLALVLDRLGQTSEAIALAEHALATFRRLERRSEEGRTLDTLGTLHMHAGDTEAARASFHGALVVQRETGDVEGERLTLANLGELYAAAKAPELAIVFYKQAVNLTERIRTGLSSLSPERRRAYAGTVAEDYRRLADLLLAEDRVIEAQRVLDLLKVEELADFLGDVSGNEETGAGVTATGGEQRVLATYEALAAQAIAFGRELAALPPRGERNEAEQARYEELAAAQRTLLRVFVEFTESEAVAAALGELSDIAREQALSLRKLRGLDDNLERLGGDVVVIYPLILADRLEIVLATAHSPPIRRTSAVDRETLQRTVLELRRALTGLESDATVLARRLYGWLIAPFAQDLEQNGTSTILYAPDGFLRYAPLAALHDGEQWLAERYRVQNITSASLDELETAPPPALSVLAGAYTEGAHAFEIGGEDFSFRGLPYARVEIETLAETVPDIEALTGAAFTLDALLPRLGDYNVLHLATHGAFVSGRPASSFLLFGDGGIATLDDMKSWPLDADLVVLSACETAVGGRYGNGEEILGLGYVIQDAGARSTVASLWPVSDGGTQLLMQAFYRGLDQGLGKAEALRGAQLHLIRGDRQALADEARGMRVPRSAAVRYDHPYFWAGFILIGNGL